VKNIAKKYNELSYTDRLQIFSMFLGLLGEYGFGDDTLKNEMDEYLRLCESGKKIVSGKLGSANYGQKLHSEKISVILLDLKGRVDEGLRSKNIKIRQAARRVAAVLAKYKHALKNQVVNVSVLYRKLVEEMQSELNARHVRVLYGLGWLDEVGKILCGLKSKKKDKYWRKKVKRLINLVGTSFVFMELFERICDFLEKMEQNGGAPWGALVSDVGRMLVPIADRLLQ